MFGNCPHCGKTQVGLLQCKDCKSVCCGSCGMSRCPNCRGSVESTMGR